MAGKTDKDFVLDYMYEINDPEVFQCICEFYLEGLKKMAVLSDAHVDTYKLEQKTGLTIQGRKENVDKFLPYVQQILRSINVDYIHLKDAKYFKTAEGKDFVENLEQKYSLKLLFEEPQDVLTEPDSDEVPPIYLWKFPEGQKLLIRCGRDIESGATIITKAFQTDKPVWNRDLNAENKNGVTLVQFPVPGFRTPGHVHTLKAGVRKLFQQFNNNGLNNFAIEVDGCDGWSVKTFTKAVISSFVDYLLARESTPGFKLTVCVLNKEWLMVAFKCCNDILLRQKVNSFQFLQINEKKNLVQVEVIQGDICKVQADVIVNTISADLDLRKGEASRALLKAAGNDLQRELDKYYRHRLDFGEIARTKGYNLRCKYVLHGSLSQFNEKACSGYKSESDFYKTSIHDFMRFCLEDADKLDCVTIAFPVIGTGTLYYPLYIVAEQMFETIETFGPELKSIQTVKIIYYQEDPEVMQMFHEYERKYREKHCKGTKTNKKTIHSRVLKITGTDACITSVKQEIEQQLKMEEAGKGEIDNSDTVQQDPTLLAGQKLVKEVPSADEIKGEKTFPGKSASRSLQNLNGSKKHHNSNSSTLSSSSSSPTSPDPPSEDEDKNKSSRSVVFEASTDNRLNKYNAQYNENRVLNKKGLKASVTNRNKGNSCKTQCDTNAQTNSKEVKELGKSLNGSPQELDMKITLTEGVREATMTDQQQNQPEDTKVILKVTESEYNLVEFFQNIIIEKYKKKGCLLAYDHNIGAIVLHGDLPKTCDINTVKMDMGNAVKKIKELQSDTIDVKPYSEQEVRKHSNQLTTGDVYCVVDTHYKELTVFSETFDIMQRTVHQLKLKLGIIKETDRNERQFLKTSHYLGEMLKGEDKQCPDITDQRGHRHDPSTRYGGARPKTIQKQSSRSPDCQGETFFTIKDIKVCVYQSNILQLKVDCIVNAANKSLQHGGGIAAAISRAAGRALDSEGWSYVKRYGELKVGEVLSTTAGKLNYVGVIHAVGPNWSDYKPHSLKKVQECERDLYNAVYNSIKEADKLGLKSIAIPGISAGIYACPYELCFVQYAKAVLAFNEQASRSTVQEIHFVDMNKDIVEYIQRIFKAMIPTNIHKPKFYDTHQFVAVQKAKKNQQAVDNYAKTNKPASKIDGHSAGHGPSRPLPSKPSQQDNVRSKTSNNPPSTYPYVSKKSLPGYACEEFVCVVSPRISLYVYKGSIIDKVNGAQMIACGDTKEGNKTGGVAGHIAKLGGPLFCDKKKQKFKTAKVGDVVVVPVAKDGVKFVAHLILYQRSETNGEHDRKGKISDMYRKLFFEAKKNKCKGLMLALPGTGPGKLAVSYATERLCEGLQAFASNDSDYGLTIHLINNDQEKTKDSIKTITKLVESLKKTSKPPKPSAAPAMANRGSDKDKNIQEPSYMHHGLGRPQSASYAKKEKPKNIGSTSLHSQIKSQEFRRRETTKQYQRHSTQSLSEESVEESAENEDDFEQETRRDRADSKDGVKADIDDGDKADSEDGDKADSEDGDKLGDCAICLEPIKNPSKLVCGHDFCTDCIEEMFTYKEVCPVCGKVCGLIKGDQPKGNIRIKTNKHRSCAGFEKFGRIEITYTFPDGFQQGDHPDPGKPYKGFTRIAFLPDNTEGKQIRDMLKIAFDRKLVFTIGSSRTTGQEGVITWNDIHHKTDPNPNTQFGYPDPTYLDRVKDELAAKGVTEADL